MAFTEAFGLFFIIFGVFFSLVGIIGLVRFPDVYTRSHAAGKVSALGAVGLLIAVGLLMPQATLKVVALLIFLVVTQPIASHAIASEAYRAGVQMVNPVRDDLTSRKEKGT